MPIRRTLAKAQRATYLVGMLTEDSPKVPVPKGSGFFVDDRGMFLTAHHVLKSGTRPATLLQDDHKGSPPSLTVTTLLAQDAEADFALLQAEVDHQHRDNPITALTPSARTLDEGEPVYAYGYPLSVEGAPITIRPSEMFPPDILEGFVDERGDPADVTTTSLTMMNHKLSARVNGAIVSSHREYYKMIDLDGTNEASTVYVLDQPLNYGISGGPVVATASGEVHALCTRFQPMPVRQPSGETVWVPSLYGIVTRLSHPKIREALERNGVAVAT